MTGEEPKAPAFRRRLVTPSAEDIRERASRKLADLKNGTQWRGGPAAPAGGHALDNGDVSNAGAPRDQEALARVQAMVSIGLRDDFFVAARREGTTAQKLIGDFVRAYVHEHGERR
jgi:hypothetical protein